MTNCIAFLHRQLRMPLTDASAFFRSSNTFSNNHPRCCQVPPFVCTPHVQKPLPKFQFRDGSIKLNIFDCPVIVSAAITLENCVSNTEMLSTLSGQHTRSIFHSKAIRWCHSNGQKFALSILDQRHVTFRFNCHCRKSVTPREISIFNFFS